MFWALLIFCGWFATTACHADSIPVQMALAKVDITPPLGGGTTGYSDAPPTDGVHDPVDARVMLLRNSNETIALVVCDLCIFNSPWLHEQASDLGIDHLLLMNTHTHSGPNLRQTDFPSTDMPWRRTVEERIVSALKLAQQSWFPAYFAADEGFLQLGYNRLVQDPGGAFSLTHFENPDRIPFGEVDPTVGVIRVTDDRERTRAVIVTYACHPVVLGPKNRKISADYPGVTRRMVEESVTKDGDDADENSPICFFIQGAAGDINPLGLARGDDRTQDFLLVERTGYLLAAEVERVLQRLSDQPGECKSIRRASSVMTFGKRFESNGEIQLGVTTLLINDQIGIVTMPGEPFHHFQVSFRERANLPHASLFGYCSNAGYTWPSYLPDIVSAARGGYGASDTTVAEVGAGERIVNRGLAQLYKLRGRLKEKPQRHVKE